MEEQPKKHFMTVIFKSLVTTILKYSCEIFQYYPSSYTEPLATFNTIYEKVFERHKTKFNAKETQQLMQSRNILLLTVNFDKPYTDFFIDLLKEISKKELQGQVDCYFKEGKMKYKGASDEAKAIAKTKEV